MSVVPVGARPALRVMATARDTARVTVRHQQFVVGRPVEFDPEAPRVAAVEYVLGAVGAELVNGLRTFARRHRVEIDDVEALVTWDLEGAMAFLEVVGYAGNPHIARAHVKVFVSAPDREAVGRLWDSMINRLPLLGTLRAAMALETELAFAS